MGKEYVWYITPEQYEKAEKNGIDRNTLSSRIRLRGWDIDRAMTEPKKKLTPFVVDEEILKKAKENGISRNALYCRIKRTGRPPEEAATMPMVKTLEARRELNAKRRKYSPEIIALAESNGISYANFKQRVRFGMPIMEAATKPVMTKAEAGSMKKRSKRSG